MVEDGSSVHVRGLRVEVLGSKDEKVEEVRRRPLVRWERGSSARGWGMVGGCRGDIGLGGWVVGWLGGWIVG